MLSSDVNVTSHHILVDCILPMHIKLQFFIYSVSLTVTLPDYAGLVFCIAW